MNAFYTKLLEEHGSNCVWEGENFAGEKEYCFSMGNALMDNEEDGFEFEDRCEGKDNIKCVSPQDEVMNCVVVKDCDLLDGVEMKFIEEWVGSNCYNR